MSREAMLAKIRTALGPRTQDAGRAVAARIANPPAPLLPARCTGARSELLARFEDFLARQGSDLIPVAAPAAIPAAVAAYLAANGLPLKVRMGRDPYLAGLPWQSPAGLVVEKGPAQSEDLTGLSRAIAGVAETGTLVLASGADNPVTLALVPETHIVVLLLETIVGSYEEACALMGSGGMPRTLNLISGASRTGDIGGKIVMGAHGPRRLAVVMVGSG